MGVQGPNGNNPYLRFKGTDGQEKTLDLSKAKYLEKNDQNKAIFNAFAGEDGVFNNTEISTLQDVGGRDHKVTAKDFHTGNNNGSLFSSLQAMEAEISSLNISNGDNGTHVVKDPKTGETRIYDSNDQLQSKTTVKANADNTSVGTTVDAQGRVTDIVNKDASGKITSSISKEYDENGNVKRTTEINNADNTSVVTTYENGVITSKTEGKIDKDGTTPLTENTFTTYENGKPIQIIETANDKSKKVKTLNQDGRVTQDVRYDADQNEIETHKYEYDADGKMVSETITKPNDNSQKVITYDKDGKPTETITDNGRELITTSDGKKQLRVEQDPNNNQWKATFDVNDDGSYGYTVQKGETINTVAKHVLALYGIENPTKDQIKAVTKELMANTKVYTMKKGKHRGAKYYLAGQELKIPTAKALGIESIAKPMPGVTAPAATEVQAADGQPPAVKDVPVTDGQQQAAKDVPVADGQQQAAAKPEPQPYSMENDATLKAAKEEHQNLESLKGGHYAGIILEASISQYTQLMTSWRDGETKKITFGAEEKDAQTATLRNGQRAYKIGDLYYPVTIYCIPDIYHPVTDEKLLP